MNKINSLNAIVEHLEKLAKEGRELIARIGASPDASDGVLLSTDPYADGQFKAMIATIGEDGGWAIDNNYTADLNPNDLPAHFAEWLILVPVYESLDQCGDLYHLTDEEQEQFLKNAPILTPEEKKQMNKK